MQKNIINNLSKAEQINLIGCGLMIISLFLNWYSDKDVFRSGDVYGGLNGPMYFLGFNLMLIALASAAGSMVRIFKVQTKLTQERLGKWQMIGGFFSMYLLIAINSIYFSAQFGLNLIDKKTEIGAMLALVAAVMMCIGGYLSFRKKFTESDSSEADNLQEQPVKVAESNKKDTLIPSTEPVVSSIESQTRPVSTRPMIRQNPVIAEDERSKVYDNLKKMMLKDTMSPVERRNTREKEASENAFSANFGKQQRAEKSPLREQNSLTKRANSTELTNKVVPKTVSSSGGGVEDLLRRAQYKKNS
jgi:hypothetical protein